MGGVVKTHQRHLTALPEVGGSMGGACIAAKSNQAGVLNPLPTHEGQLAQHQCHPLLPHKLPQVAVPVKNHVLERKKAKWGGEIM